MKTLHVAFITLILISSIIIMSGCREKNNTQTTDDAYYTYDTLYVDSVDIIDFADTCVCDSVEHVYDENIIEK